MRILTEFRVILRSFKRHRLTVVLLSLQMAASLALACNSMQMVLNRLQSMHQVSGLNESGLVMLDSTQLDPQPAPIVLHQTQLHTLRQLAGVQSVVAVDALPYNQNDWSNGIATGPEGSPGRHSAHPSAFNGTPGELQTLGLHLLAGRDFLPDEYLPMDSAHGWSGIERVPTTIISQALAQRLFPEGHALGQSLIANSGPPIRIVGIVERLLRPSPHGHLDDGESMLFPMLPDTHSVCFVLRLQSTAHADQVLAQATKALRAQGVRLIIEHPMRFDQLRTHYFQHDRELIGLLLLGTAGLLGVTAIGIAGLANYWVQQRRRSIGIRRALGATRNDMRWYFLIEIAAVAGMALPPGAALCYLIHHVLMIYGELPQLPVGYVALTWLVILLVASAAVLGPAWRASMVAPVAAIRH